MPHRDALGVQVATVGAVVEVHLIEDLCGGTDEMAVVVEAVAVLGDDHLTEGHHPEGLCLQLVGVRSGVSGGGGMAVWKVGQGEGAWMVWLPAQDLKQGIAKT